MLDKGSRAEGTPTLKELKMFANYINQKHLLSPEECNLIRESCLTDLKAAEIQTPDNAGEHGDIKESVRKAKSSFIFRDKGIYTKNEELQLVIDKVIWMFCNIAQEAFKCPLNSIEPIQFGQYSEGEFYDWHMDSGPQTDRDISASVFLDDAKEYEGGEFEFFTKSLVRPEQTQGSMIVFPSLMTHKVSPVKKGHRHSLVLWGSRQAPAFQPEVTLTPVENKTDE